MVPAGCLFIGLFFIVESPRYSARKGQDVDALRDLAYLRGGTIDDKEVLAEMAEINAQLAEQGQGNNAEGTAPAADESADSARGMSAETGSNSVAQALAALAVAAMVAAGAFAARRKFFA